MELFAIKGDGFMGNENWGNWFRSNLDKLILMGLVAIFATFTLHLVHHGADKEMISWGREEVGTVLGSLIMVLTGRANSGKNDPPAK